MGNASVKLEVIDGRRPEGKAGEVRDLAGQAKADGAQKVRPEASVQAGPVAAQGAAAAAAATATARGATVAAPAAPAPPATAKSPRASADELESAPAFTLTALISYTVVAVVLYLGWRMSFDEHIVAEEGLGYNLGIIGGSMMLLLLLYPLRKKAKFMRGLGATRYWFQAHMILGVLGPVLVAFHANFRFGSTNSTIALVSTILVAGSGLVGRYIYSRIHYGLYGRKKSYIELRKELEQKKSSLSTVLAYAPSLQGRLLALDTKILKTRTSFLQSFFHYIVIGPIASWTHIRMKFALRKVLDVAARRDKWSAEEKRLRSKEAREHISAHIATALMISEFSVYERLFSLWHVLHFPLFIMLIIVAVVHVFAVHLY